MKKTLKKIIGVLLVVVLSALAISAVFSSVQGDGTKEEVKNFCVVYNGKKILKDTYSFELVENDAAFSIETLDGEPIKDYSVSVRAAFPADDFDVVFNGAETLSWEKDFAQYDYSFASAGIAKDGNTFTIANTRFTTLLSNEFPGMDIQYEGLTSPKNVLKIDVTVNGATLSIHYFVDVPVESITLSEGSVVW